PTAAAVARPAQSGPVLAPPTAPAPQAPSPPAASVAAARPVPIAIPSGPLIWPVVGPITQRFMENGHTGIDIAAPQGTPAKAAAAGTVVVAAKLSYGYGWRIMIDHGGGYTTLYAHLSGMNVSEGAQVTKGQIIGAVGMTGFATGPHLHFEVALNGQITDPAKLLP